MCRGVLAGWASTPRLGLPQARRFCCALLHSSHPAAARMTATQGRLEAEIPVFARTDATGPGSGLGVGVKSGVDAGGSGVTLGAGGSGVGAGGGRHFCVEESHSTQPFPSHTPTEGVVAWEAPPKRRVVPMNPRRTPTKIISSGVRFLGLVAIALPFSGRWLM